MMVLTAAMAMRGRGKPIMEDGASQSAYVDDFVMIYAVCSWNYRGCGSVRLLLPSVRPFMPTLLFSPHSTDFDVQLRAINGVHPVRPTHTSHKQNAVPTGAVQVTRNFQRGEKFHHRDPPRCFGGALAN
jgi:hypothetical protein